MSNEMEEIELGIEEAKKLVDKKNQLEKLFSNREFRKIIEEGYFQEEAKRLVALSGDIAPTVKENRDEILLEMQAISKLQQYFRNIMMIGSTAEQAIQEYREAADEIREGELV